LNITDKSKNKDFIGPCITLHDFVTDHHFTGYRRCLKNYGSI